MNYIQLFIFVLLCFVFLFSVIYSFYFVVDEFGTFDRMKCFLGLLFVAVEIALSVTSLCYLYNIFFEV